MLSLHHSFFTDCIRVTMDATHLRVSRIDGTHVSIDRRNLAVSSVGDPGPESIDLGYVRGIIGIKHLVKRSYLLAINASTCVDEKYRIFKIDRVAIFPIQDVTPSRYESYRDRIEWQWEDIYLKMINDLFKAYNFYYSGSYDLTNSFQKNEEISAKIRKEEPYRYADPRFHWNLKLLELFSSSDKVLNRFGLPIIMGFIKLDYIDRERNYRWLYISRRGTRRAGTRYNKRGVDEEGNVANFVETEQIVSAEDSLSSFVQIRGSIPMYWSQTPTCRYKPDIEIHSRDHETAMEKHYRELKSIYGEVSVACLIDQKGHEAELAKEFTKQMSYMQTKLCIRYHYFDFHKECGKMRWHRLSLLLENLKLELDSYGMFVSFSKDPGHDSKRALVVTRQTGVIRSNCIDSLDRTNVVQSMISEYVLDIQLRTLAIPSLSEYPSFVQVFKDTWADNADALSIQYAGTPALKTDFTRTGERTYAGIMRDGLNSATRYVSNNYLDSYRQDSIDLLLGNFVGYPSPNYRPLDLASYSSTFPVAIVMLTLVALYVYFRHDSLRWLDN